MPKNDFHLADLTLLQMIDHELSPKDAHRARSHLAICNACQERLGKLEAAAADLAQLVRTETDADLLDAAASRARLRSRLGDAVVKSRVASWQAFWQFLHGQSSTARFAACTCTLAIVVVGAMLMTHAQWPARMIRGTSAALEDSPEPNRLLTPGATRPVAISDICPGQQREAERVVSISTQSLVFQEYGIAKARPEDYELDYLVTPELGGSDDPRNLWPEPHSTTVWNSYVKDDLENRLHQMVCDGTVDLVTAQHEIETDWIAAYKKYFHTDRPFPAHAGLPSKASAGPNS